MTSLKEFTPVKEEFVNNLLIYGSYFAGKTVVSVLMNVRFTGDASSIRHRAPNNHSKYLAADMPL